LNKVKKGLLWTEWVVLFWIYPWIGYFDWFRISKFILFGLPVGYAALIGLVVLRKERANVQRRYFKHHGPWAGALLLVIGLLAAYVWLRYPDHFLEIPLGNPRLWVMILILYPLISAYPQEYLYRSFYFRRYSEILPGGWPGVLINAASFAFLHIIYDNVTAVLLTFVGGLWFAGSYLHTRRVLYPWIEHAILGLAIFTFGLGRFFYEPVGG
jgi:hypothetical protein